MSDMVEQMEMNFANDVPSNFADCPEPGLHRDVPFEKYASWKALNSGCIRQPTMRHVKAAFDGEIANDDTKSRKFGRAVHTRFLEPEHYKERVLIAESCSAELKSGDRKGQRCGKTGSCVDEAMRWYCGTHKPADASVPTEYVSADEAERIESMASNLHGHKAMDLLRADGWSECSVVFDWNGLKVKGRLDRFSESARFALDVKKMRVGKGSMDDCRHAIDEYGYLTQFSVYWKAVEVLCGFRPRCLWLFIEEDAPFDVQLVEAEEWELEHAWQSVAGVLDGFQSCVESGYFPGYVRFGNDGTILSNHLGALPLRKAKLIQEGRA